MKRNAVLGGIAVIGLVVLAYVSVTLAQVGSVHVPLGGGEQIAFVLWTPTATRTPTPTATPTPRATPTPKAVRFPPNTQMDGTALLPDKRSGGFAANFTLINNSEMDAVNVEVTVGLTDDQVNPAVSVEESVTAQLLTAGSEWRGGVLVPIDKYQSRSVWVDWTWRDPETGRLSGFMRRVLLP